VNYIFFILFVVLISCSFVISANAELVSYWHFDNTLEDSGPAKNNLHVSTPILMCNDPYPFSACWTDDIAKLSEEFYVPAMSHDGFYFNRFTFLATDPANESNYDFLEIDKPFTIDFWARGEQYCLVSDACTHQYLFSKAVSTYETNPNVIGVAGGIQRDGAFYMYLRNDHEIMYAQTNEAVFDNTPHKYTVVYLGDGKRTNIQFYVDGKKIPLHPSTGDSFSVPQIFDTVTNDSPLVIGNYWFTFGQSFGDGWIDEFKIFDSALTSEDILSDYQSQISKSTQISATDDALTDDSITSLSNMSIGNSTILLCVIVFSSITILLNFLVVRHYFQKLEK